MISQLNTGFSRDRNLNFRKPADANNVQIVDNHEGNKARDDNKTTKESNTSIQKSKEEARKKEEYANYRNTFSDGKPLKTYAQEESSNSSRNLLIRSASIKENNCKSPDPKRLITSNSQEKEMRSAPAKPKCLVPPAQRLGISPQKLKKQGSNDRTPTPTQQAHLKKIKSQTSEEEDVVRKETTLQRQILFDELEELEERIEHFKADAKSENISVQGAEKFEKIVNFNKQLRQFKKVHDRNKLVCQESLREDSQEEQNYIPELPESKDISSLYKGYEKPKLVRIKTEKALKEFQEKHKKLAASYIHQREHKADEKLTKIKNKINSPILTDKTIDKFPTSLHGSELEKKEELLVKDIIPKSLKDIKDLEKEIFKSIESLNIDSDEAPSADKADYASKLKFDKPEDMLKRISDLKYINPLSTSIDETMFEPLPAKESPTEPETPSRIGDIQHLIQQFDQPKESSKEYKKTVNAQGVPEIQEVKTNGHATKITNDAILEKIEADVDNKKFTKRIEKSFVGGESPISDEIIALYTQKSMSNVSPLEGWSDRTNSMNKEVINFEEELLNYEADSLNPPDKGQKGISYMNSKRIKQISFEEKEVENAEKEKSALRSGFLLDANKNEKIITEITVLQKGYRFGSKRHIDENKESKSNINIEKSEKSENNEEKVSTFSAESENINNSGNKNLGTRSRGNNSENSIFQSGFLLNGNAKDVGLNDSSRSFKDNENKNSKKRIENNVQNLIVKDDAIYEKENSKTWKDKPLFQSGFLLNSENTNKTKKWDSDSDSSTLDRKAEEKSQNEGTNATSHFKSRFLLSTAIETSETKNLDSSLSGVIKENGKDYIDTDFEKGIHEAYETKDRDYTFKIPRKKSVHFESSNARNESQIKKEDVSPVKSFFPKVDPITSAGSKTKVPETSQYQREGVKKMTNGILTNLNSQQNSSRKESLDSVDMELIKLGLHKTSDDIRSQYLSKLHITSPPSKISSLIMKDELPAPETHYYSTSQPIPASVSQQTKTATNSTWSSTSTTDTNCRSVASDECTALLKKEEMITEENARLTSKSEVQKSNFELSKSLNVLRPLVIPASISQANDAKENVMKGAQTPIVPTMRPRPPIRPMYMSGGYLQIGPGRMRGMSPIHRPRLNFPYGPPRHLKASPPLRPTGPNNMRTSPPPRHMHFYRSPSPTHGLIRITPRHLPPNFRQRFPGRESPLGMGHRFSPPHKVRQHPPIFSPQRLRSPRASHMMLLRGNFSPVRPPQFSPNSPQRFRRFSPVSPMRPNAPPFYRGGPRPCSPRSPRFANARFAMRPRMPTISSGDQPDKQNMREVKSSEEKASLMKDLDTRIVVQNYDHRIRVKAPEVASLTCSDLLTAYRLTQNLTRNRPYRYDPAETLDLHRRLTVNSRRIFDKLTSPRKEKKGPYVPNREIMRLFGNTTEDRGREKLVMENEEFIYKNKESNERTGQFFGSQNPELLEKFEATHEYIKKLYEHSKDNLLPPSDEFADVHDRVKYFCGVKNEELLEKLKVVEERVLQSEWSGRVKDAKEKMSRLYEENREFLAKFKKSQEDKVNNLLDENKELIDNMKAKAATFDQMMESTVCDAI